MPDSLAAYTASPGKRTTWKAVGFYGTTGGVLLGIRTADHGPAQLRRRLVQRPEQPRLLHAGCLRLPAPQRACSISATASATTAGVNFGRAQGPAMFSTTASPSPKGRRSHAGKSPALAGAAGFIAGAPSPASLRIFPSAHPSRTVFWMVLRGRRLDSAPQDRIVQIAGHVEHRNAPAAPMTCSASSRPFIPGMTTSVRSRSIGPVWA